jgi:hypothetical protein
MKRQRKTEMDYLRKFLCFSVFNPEISTSKPDTEKVSQLNWLPTSLNSARKQEP